MTSDPAGRPAAPQDPDADGDAPEQGPDADGDAPEQGPDSSGDALEQGPDAGGDASEQGPDSSGDASEQGPDSDGDAPEIAAPNASSAAARFRAWLDGAPLSREVCAVVGLICPAIVLTVNMWRVRTFTIDDAYISFRYARNLAHGLGLVYNAGERIEGYTNFLWTVILAGFIRIGADPDITAKVLGALSAYGALGVTYVLASRFRPFTTLPCIATWLLASTIVFSGYAVFGLETALFSFLLLSAMELMMRETDQPARFPLSGVVFGLAGLTRPEAPMFIGILMLFLGRRFFARQNLLRGVLFALPIAVHVLFRHAYYGTWLPNTLSAKTGDLTGQLHGGFRYVQDYAGHAGAVLWLSLVAVASALLARRRDLLAITALSLAGVGYVILVGGDWMPFFRFMAPLEPLVFLLVDVGARSIADRRDRAANLALALFGLAMLVHRADALRSAQNTILHKEQRFWTMAAGGTARWFQNNARPGEIAIGDIGYVGYATDYPILDLLGLVDPVISKLPGGYTRKLGPGFTNRFFEKKPRYFLLISSHRDCQHPSVPGSQVLYRDRRFRQNYQVSGKVPLDNGFAWCIYEHKSK